MRDEGYDLASFDKYCLAATGQKTPGFFSTNIPYRLLIDVEDQLVVLRIEWYDKYEYPDWERGYYHRFIRSQPRAYWNILVDFAQEVVENKGEVHYLVEDI